MQNHTIISLQNTRGSHEQAPDAQDDVEFTRYNARRVPLPVTQPDPEEPPRDPVGELLDGMLPGVGPPDAPRAPHMRAAEALGRRRFKLANVVLFEGAGGSVGVEILPPNERRATDEVQSGSNLGLQASLAGCQNACTAHARRRGRLPPAH